MSIAKLLLKISTVRRLKFENIQVIDKKNILYVLKFKNYSLVWHKIIVNINKLK